MESPPDGGEVSRDSTVGVEALVRELVQSLNDRPPAGPAADPEIVLEVELDGARYMLTRQQPVSPQPHPPLSAREREIARMIACGHTNKTIAAVLEISSWTVGTHLRRIYSKLAVHSRSAMVARLAEDGDLGPPELQPGNWDRLWSK